jgi:hypothetical protein
MREINTWERKLLKRLFEVSFCGRDELKLQTDRAKVNEIDRWGGLEFVVDPSLPRASVKTRIPVEAEGVDKDGVNIHILLHVVDGRAQELEFFKEDGSDIMALPDVSKLQLHHF